MIQVIYIPGLGDARVTFQHLAMKTWRLWGVKPHLCHMRWDDDEPYDQKYDRLMTLIKDVASEGPIAVVGASAGAAIAIAAYADCPDQVKVVVLLAGKVCHPETVGGAYKQRSPAFWEAAQRAPEALNRLSAERRQHILSRRAKADGIVPARDSIIDGAHNQVVATRGHALTIGTQLLFGAPSFVRFIKRSIDSQVVTPQDERSNS